MTKSPRDEMWPAAGDKWRFILSDLSLPAIEWIGLYLCRTAAGVHSGAQVGSEGGALSRGETITSNMRRHVSHQRVTFRPG